MNRFTPFALATMVMLAGFSTGAASGAPEAQTAAAPVDAAVRAVRTAGTSGSGTPYSIDRERFRGNLAWEVDVGRASGRSAELLISADGRRVLRSGTTPRSADTNRARNARVSLATALRTAARRANGNLEEADVDRHRGRTVWSVTFIRRGTETEVYVDAANGRVVRVETDD